MLMPLSGASTAMYAATSAPAPRPVNRAHPATLETTRTIVMSPSEITNSAMNAPAAPSAPGSVAAYFTEGCARRAPRMAAATMMPASPPANCART
ncbi:MAG: hypothetical protein AUH81_17270 [Candidatus Rokubacteria bacterium 13_1_40CM_4_69_5]|nr:MAG: hypothetical protein AUH81_17270 [Candidatus Rokubacteria bacterium 13_1_40CM_4_69_5]